MTRKTVWKIALRWTIEQNNTPCVGSEQVSQLFRFPHRGLFVYAPFFLLVVQIFSSPNAHCVENRQNRLTKIRQFILHLRRHHRIHMPLHQTVFFQFAKLLCQHLRRHLRHQPLQTAEPQSAVCQMIQNQCFPFSPNQSQRCLNRTIIGNLSCVSLHQDSSFRLDRPLFRFLSSPKP